MPIYEYVCNGCGKKVEEYSRVMGAQAHACECGAVLEQIYSLYKPDIFQEYTTNNIMKDGSAVRVTSAAQESRLCKENGVVKADGKLKTGGF